MNNNKKQIKRKIFQKFPKQDLIITKNQTSILKVQNQLKMKIFKDLVKNKEECTNIN